MSNTIAARSIAFLCHPYHRGGVTRWMADAAMAFAERGWQCYFVTPSPVESFHSAGAAETMIHLLRSAPASLKVISESVGGEFEFGTPEYKTYIYCRLLAAGVPVGTPIILSDDAAVWAAAGQMSAAYPFVGVLHSDEQQYYDHAKQYHSSIGVFTCVSERVHQTVRKLCPAIDPSLIFTIPCGIQLPPVRFVANNSGRLRLVYVGRLTEYQKRISDLAGLAAVLARRNVDFQFTIIGDGGEDRRRLEQLVAENGLKDKVTFAGWQVKKSVEKNLAESDILVLTSDFEGTPISMMEALASGCGFVGTRVSGIEDYADRPGAQNCYRIFEVGDLERAADFIIELSSVLPVNRQSAARKLAEAEFSMDTCLDRYQAAIAAIKPATYVQVKAVISSSALIRSRLMSAARGIKLAFALRK